MIKEQKTESLAKLPVAAKREYTSPEASVESYNVERGFAASGAFEGLSESGNSYNDSNFT